MSRVLRPFCARPDGSPLYVIFECPGCGFGHMVRVGGDKHPKWTWNGSYEKPTFDPSYVVVSPPPRCHSFIRDGRIQFLGDCEHDLKGQTVDLPPIDDVRTGGDLG